MNHVVCRIDSASILFCAPRLRDEPHLRSSQTSRMRHGLAGRSLAWIHVRSMETLSRVMAAMFVLVWSIGPTIPQFGSGAIWPASGQSVLAPVTVLGPSLIGRSDSARRAGHGRSVTGLGLCYDGGTEGEEPTFFDPAIVARQCVLALVPTIGSRLADQPLAEYTHHGLLGSGRSPPPSLRYD